MYIYIYMYTHIYTYMTVPNTVQQNGSLIPFKINVRMTHRVLSFFIAANHIPYWCLFWLKSLQCLPACFQGLVLWQVSSCLLRSVHIEIKAELPHYKPFSFPSFSSNQMPIFLLSPTSCQWKPHLKWWLLFFSLVLKESTILLLFLLLIEIKHSFLFIFSC